MNVGKKTYYNRYPTVFIHGFLGWGSDDKIDSTVHYWGATKDRDLLAHLREKGYEVYNPSVGPFNAAWDRSCELYARIMGGTVDYGKVHSEKYGHKRYGRTYPGFLKDWGTEGDHAKINLIGHSFGGPTVRMFAELMANGSEEERAGTPAGELSGLFEGGHKDMIHTVTTLSGVNNGTTYDDLHGKKGMEFVTRLLLEQIVRVGDSRYMRFKDYHMEQWELMDDPVHNKRFHLQRPAARYKQIKRFLNNNFDNIGYEMSLEGMSEINEKIQPQSNTYYFARRACRTHPDRKGNQVPDKNMSAFCDIPGFLSGRYINNDLKKYGFSRKWLPNDGFVNTEGLSAPLNEPYIDWDPTVQLKPGLWYNMPVEDKDHMSWMGFGEKTTVLFRYYEDMLELFRMLPDGE